MAATLALAASGCARTSRIAEEDLSVRRLKSEGRAIALLRVGAASDKCLHVAVLIGVAHGEGYRRERVLAVANVRSLATAPVAESEFEAGEYHVIGYACTNDKGSKTVADDTGPMSSLYRTSYARFALAPGEVINLGHLHVEARHEGDSLFGRPIVTKMSVTDWSLPEIERFAAARPTIYATMRTRLLEVGPPRPSADEQARICATWRTLTTTGKARDVPTTCGQS